MKFGQLDATDRQRLCAVHTKYGNMGSQTERVCSRELAIIGSASRQLIHFQNFRCNTVRVSTAHVRLSRRRQPASSVIGSSKVKRKCSTQMTKKGKRRRSKKKSHWTRNRFFKTKTGDRKEEGEENKEKKKKKLMTCQSQRPVRSFPELSSADLARVVESTI